MLPLVKVANLKLCVPFLHFKRQTGPWPPLPDNHDRITRGKVLKNEHTAASGFASSECPVELGLQLRFPSNNLASWMHLPKSLKNLPKTATTLTDSTQSCGTTQAKA